MPDIKNSIKFDDGQEKLIKLKLADGTFTFKNWSDDDLQDLRSTIRKFYRHEQVAICAYCKAGVSLQSASNCHVEHIAPKSRYRDFIFEPKNLCVICSDCNEIKREQETLNEVPDTVKNGSNRKRYPRTPDAFKIVHPHFDVYDDHILIFADKFYVNKTDKGHFTIGACNLNRRLEAFGWEQLLVDENKFSELIDKFKAEPDSIKRAAILGQFKRLLLLI